MRNVLTHYVLILNPSKCGSSWLAHGMTIRPFMAFPREFDFLFFVGFPPERQWNTATATDEAFLDVRDDATLTAEEKLCKIYEIERSRRSDAEILIDKAPSNIHLFLEYRHIYKQTPTILLYRDPRDVYISNELYHQRQLELVEQRDDIGTAEYLRSSHVFASSMSNCAKVRTVERQLQEDGVDFLCVTYEQMKTDFVDVLTRAIDFCGIDVGVSTEVRSNYVEHAIPFAEHLQRAKDFKPLFRKGIIGDWKNYISTPEAKDVVKEKWGDLLIDLGYETGYDW
jgi:hypothetical protein